MTAKRLRINIPGFGALTGRYQHDWATGATTYTVTGPRVAGTFVIRHNPRTLVPVPGADRNRGASTPCEVLDVDAPQVHVQYGGGNKPDFLDYERDDLPRVNGITLCGGTGIDVDRMRERRLRGRDVNVRRGRYYRSVPEATQERTAVVLHGLVAHWAGRPENYALRLACCRDYAADRGRVASAKLGVDRAWERVEVARRELEREQAWVGQLAEAAAMPPAVVAGGEAGGDNPN
ncbi:hypothetical protein [Actinomadura meridiana]